MPIRAAGLTAAKVRTAAPGRYGDGDGLYVLVRSETTAFWVFRYTRAGKLREMGLGRARGPNAVTLAQARVRAGELHRAVRAGIDPLAANDASVAAARATAQQQAIAARTFRDAARDFIANKRAEWRNGKHKGQWSTSLEAYAYPHLGDIPVALIDTSHILAVLDPIWRTKSETASRVRGRIEVILDAEKVRGHRTGENPARWRDHLRQILPAISKVAPVEHHPALPYVEMPIFFRRIQAARGVGARALEFSVLTCARTGMTLEATWGEIDLREAIWIVPGPRMKSEREFRLPLSRPALAVLEEMIPHRMRSDPGAYIFPGSTSAGHLSNATMLAVLKRLNRPDITTHGFRSSFKDWATERTNFQSEVSELALSHAVGDKVEAAYRRGDLFQKRRELSDAWGAFCIGYPAANSTQILPG
jgi:integrase